MEEIKIYRVACLTGPENKFESYEWLSDDFFDYADAYEEYKKMGGENDDKIIIEERTEYFLEE